MEVHLGRSTSITGRLPDRGNKIAQSRRHDILLQRHPGLVCRPPRDSVPRAEASRSGCSEGARCIDPIHLSSAVLALPVPDPTRLRSRRRTLVPRGAALPTKYVLSDATRTPAHPPTRCGYPAAGRRHHRVAHRRDSPDRSREGAATRVEKSIFHRRSMPQQQAPDSGAS